MFTGLIEYTGRLAGRELHGEAGKLVVELSGPRPADLVRGESIAVNGVCLTLEKGMDGGDLTFHVLRETFSRTNLGRIPVGGVLNLERAMRADGRFGGHIVSGHVDFCAEIRSFRRRESDMELEISLPEEYRLNFVEKGSVAVDGISLTVEAVGKDFFRIGLIPTTLEHTNLSSQKAGGFVNIETDLLGKYVLRFLQRKETSAVTMDTLAGAGFL